VVEEFLKSLKETVIGFSGNLGAGKTTFTKELLKQLGFQGSVISPTFVLRRDYEVQKSPQPPLKGGVTNALKIIHIDAYRLEKPEQIYQVISKEELRDKNNLIIVEWPELSENIFDDIYLFEHVDENTRKISKK
jgi:tRNA threonylcarbamoyladenosine biosynthesis protein TsaE